MEDACFPNSGPVNAARNWAASLKVPLLAAASCHPTSCVSFMIHAGLPPRIHISGLPALSGVLTEGSTLLISDYYSTPTEVRLK